MYQEPSRIAVVCDCPIYLRGIAGLLGETPDLLLVAAVREAGELDGSLDSVDVLLLDREPPGCTPGWEGPPVIVIRGGEAQPDVITAIRSGASGYLTEHVEEAELLAAIRTVVHGRSYICSRLARWRAAEDAVHITERERQILKLVAEGSTDREIAAGLAISEYTVHSHLDRLRDKTASRRRADLTRFAIAHGIVAPTRHV